MCKGKYNFYEIVIIDSKKKSLFSINGKKGVIRGKSQSEGNPNVFAYAVDILNDKDEIEDGWFVYEEDLKFTGLKADPNKFRSDETVKVRVDPKTGEGEIVDDE